MPVGCPPPPPPPAEVILEKTESEPGVAGLAPPAPTVIGKVPAAPVKQVPG